MRLRLIIIVSVCLLMLSSSSIMEPRQTVFATSSSPVSACSLYHRRPVCSIKITCAAPGEASEVMPDASVSGKQTSTTFCAGCAKWRWTTQFRRGIKLGVSKHKTRTGEHCRECRCTGCRVYQALSAFQRTKRGRVDICRECELIPCAV